MKGFLTLFILLITFAGSSQSVYYVSTTGNSGNTGLSSGSPWDLPTAFSNASAGDVVWIKQGVYSDFNIIQINNGTAANRITFKGYTSTINDLNTTTSNTYSYGDAINGNVIPLLKENRAASGVGAGTGIIIRGDYVTLENFGIQYYRDALRIEGNYAVIKNVSIHEAGNFDPSLTSPPNPNAFLNYAGKGINIFGQFGNYTNNYVQNCGAEGISVRAGNNTFLNTEVHADNTVNPMDYYFLFGGGSNNSLTNTIIYRHGNLAHYGHGITMKSSGVTTNNIVDGFTITNTNLELQFPGVYGNTFRNGSVTKLADGGSSDAIAGMTLANGSHDNFFDNIIIENGNIKFSDWNDGASGDVTESSYNNIFNQLVVVPQLSAIAFSYFGNNNYSSSAYDNKFYNCTFYKGYGNWLFERSRANSGTEFINCIFSGFTTYGFPRSSSPGYAVVATWTSTNLFNSSQGSIDGVQTNVTTVDPLFTNPAARDFSLQVGSPMLDQGIATPYLSAGNDIGAIQSGGGAPADVTPPSITNITESLIKEDLIQVEINLDEGSTGRIEWGLTASYGNFTTLETNYLTFHRQSFSGLTPGTLYHYRFLGGDAAGNTLTGSDRTATTLGGGENPNPPPILGSVKDLRGKHLKRKKLF